MTRNHLGADRSGRRPLPNLGDGVSVRGSGTVIGSPADPNVIASNTGNGVYLEAGSGNTISGNRIFANGARGIRLAAGADSDLAPPQIAGITPGVGSVTGNLGRPSSAIDPELFAVDAADPEGGEGQVFLGRLEGVVTDPPGAFPAAFRAIVPAGLRVLSLTATDLGGRTSAFSLCERG